MMQQILELSQAPNPAFVIAYYGAEVEIGYWDGMAFSYCKNRNLSEEDLMEIHIFNEATEFRAVRNCETGEWQMLLLEDESILEQIKQNENKETRKISDKELSSLIDSMYEKGNK